MVKFLFGMPSNSVLLLPLEDTIVVLSADRKVENGQKRSIATLLGIKRQKKQKNQM